MKGFIFSIAVIQSLAVVVQSHKGCAFMPDHFFEDILNNPDHTEETKQIANFTLQYTKEVRGRRSAYNGIEASDDDIQYPEEESPDDAAILQAELASYNAVESGPADPDSVESPQPSSSRIRRQSSSLMRFIHNDNMGCDQRNVGVLVRNEVSGRALDQAINNVFDGFYWTDRLYRTIYGRNSIDNRGENFRARVHHCSNLNNAFWDGISMLFGDGDGVTTYRNAYAASQDVIGHEVTHGVIERSNPLHYFSQTGALNEHLADVFGVLSRQFRSNTQARSDSWSLGANINRDGSVIRSFSNPALGRQPAVMANYYYGEQDAYGVHINSGIPNHAFYLFAYAQGGYAWQVPGHIWYNVLVQGQGQFNKYSETFATFAQRTLSAAGKLYGADTAARLRTAWVQTGVLQ